MMRHIAHYPGQYAHPLLTKGAALSLSDMPTIDPSTGRFHPTYPGGGNPNLRGVKPLAYVEEYISNAVSFTPTVEYTEPKTISVYCAETGWSASVDASKPGWAVSLLEKAEAHDDKYMSDYLDRNSDFSDYKFSSRKAAAEETLDEKTLREDPEGFVPTECYLCGELAAKSVGSPFEDEMCNKCNDRAERIYAEQGGQ